MKYKTRYGTLKLEILDNKIQVVSDFPFNKFKKEFTSSQFNEAVDFFKKKRDEIDKVVEELEKKKKEKSVESKLFNKIMNLLDRNGRKILLYGPTGTGKTYVLLNVCKKLKEEKKINDYLIFHMSSGMEDIDLLGKFIPQSDKSLKFEESQLVKYIKKAEKERIIIILDEFNRVHSKALNILIPLLDEKDGYVYLNNYIKNEIIRVPAKNVAFFLTANFGGNYVGTYKIDSAILNRVDYCLFVDYQDDVEEQIVSDLPDDKQKFLFELRNFLRDLYKNGSIEPFSTRDFKILAREIETVELTFEKVWDILQPIIYKIVKTDMFGFPDEETLTEIKQFVKELTGGD